MNLMKVPILAPVAILCFTISCSVAPTATTEKSESPAPIPTTEDAGHPPHKGAWQIYSGTSSLDDSATVVLALDAANPISGWPMQTKKPQLILRCREGKTDAYIKLGMQTHVEFEDGDQIASMRGRYDKGKVREYSMGKSTDGESIFFPRPIEEIKHMLSKSDAIYRVIPFNSAPAEMWFDLTDIKEAVAPLRKACRW